METLLTLLETTGLEVAYRSWKVAPPFPYLVYLFTNSADLMADDHNYAELSDWQVELYSADKDTASEAAVEEVLKGAKIPYEKRETYLETEDMYQVLYLIRTT
jgi:hypothetical protein